MRPADRHSRGKPAAWRTLCLGLLAALSLSLQGGAALAHTHAGDVEAATENASVLLAAASRDGGENRPSPADSGTQCPLGHSPLSHGGILTTTDSGLVVGVRYAAHNARPPAQAPPQQASRPLPPARAPPASI